MTVTLPEHIPALRNMTEDELKQEFSLALFSARRLTLIQAADLAGLGLFEFQMLLRDRRISQHYDEQDLEHDLLTFRKLRSQ